MKFQIGLRALVIGVLSMAAIGCGVQEDPALAQLPAPSEVAQPEVTTSVPEAVPTTVPVTSAPETTQVEQVEAETSVPVETVQVTTTQAPQPTVATTTAPDTVPVPVTAPATTVAPAAPEVVEVVKAQATVQTPTIDGLVPIDDMASSTRINPRGGEGPSVKPPGNQIFAYAPATVFVGGDERTYYCGNKASNNGKVIDSIMLDDTNSAIEVLATTRGEWDSAHVCDPDVVEGNFSYQGAAYQWAMVYTGTQDPQGTGYGNQVGLAFSNDMRNWTKYPRPIVTYGGPNWGVGQPSLVSVDNGGQVLLFYTKSDPTTSTSAMHLDLSDVTNGPRVIRSAWEIPVNGLYGRSDGVVQLHNGEFAYDAVTDRFLVIRPMDFNNLRPDFLATSLQVAEISASQLWAGSGTWSSIKVISPQETGFGKNHNGGIATDSFGRLRDAQKLHLKFTGTPNMAEGAPIWEYNIYEMIALRSVR